MLRSSSRDEQDQSVAGEPSLRARSRADGIPAAARPEDPLTDRAAPTSDRAARARAAREAALAGAGSVPVDRTRRQVEDLAERLRAFHEQLEASAPGVTTAQRGPSQSRRAGQSPLATPQGPAASRRGAVVPPRPGGGSALGASNGAAERVAVDPARARAAAILAAAEASAAQIREGARAEAASLRELAVAEARASAERVRAQAERMLSEAEEIRAEAEEEAAQIRAAAAGEIEHARDSFVSAVQSAVGSASALLSQAHVTIRAREEILDHRSEPIGREPVDPAVPEPIAGPARSSAARRGSSPNGVAETVSGERLGAAAEDAGFSGSAEEQAPRALDEPPAEAGTAEATIGVTGDAETDAEEADTESAGELDHRLTALADMTGAIADSIQDLITALGQRQATSEPE